MANPNDTQIFQSPDGRRLDVIAAPMDLPMNPAVGWQLSDFTRFNVLDPTPEQIAASGDMQKLAMHNIIYVDESNPPNGVHTDDEFLVPQLGTVSQSGRTTYAPIVFQAYQTIADNPGVELLIMAKETKATLIYRWLDQNGLVADIGAVHVNEANRGAILNGQAAVGFNLKITQGGSYRLPMIAPTPSGG